MPSTRHSPWYALLAGTLALAGTARAQSTLELQWADARVPGGGALLYREQHLLRSEAGRPRERLVLYRCADGRAFARKLLDYSVSAQAPSFALEDRRAGYREGMRRVGARVELYAQARGDEAERVASLSGAPEVVDAGFDEFVRAHWRELESGQPLVLQFALPARGRALSFQLQKLRRARATPGAPAPATPAAPGPAAPRSPPAPAPRTAAASAGRGCRDGVGWTGTWWTPGWGDCVGLALPMHRPCQPEEPC
jgi:hypothetical protein